MANEYKLRGQLWRIVGEGSDPSGGGCVVLYAITDGPDKLPDCDKAYSLTRGRNPAECGLYRIDEVRAVSGVQVEADASFIGLVLENAHDQRTAHWLVSLEEIS